MKDRLRLRHAAAILACAASLAGTTAVLAPTAASARATESCGSKTIQIPQKSGKALSVPVSRITVGGGATCAEAVMVIRGALLKDPPPGWVVRTGHFQVPHGLVAKVATKGAKTVRYATVA